jgi:hypothetical protein
MIRSRHKPVARTATPSSPESAVLKNTSILAWIGSLVGVISTVLLLLGYGAALSAESAFGMPHSALFQGANELLDLGGMALGTWMVHALELLQSLRFFLEYLSRVGQLVQVLILGVAVPAVLWALQRLFGIDAKGWLRTGTGKLSSAKGKGMAAAVLAVAAMTLSPLLALVLVAAVGAAIAAIPVFGMIAGESHLARWVIGPEKCAWLVDRDNRLKRIEAIKNGTAKRNEGPPVVQCVRLLRDGEEVGRGRVAFATSSAVVLYNSKTGSVKRLPIDDVDIEVIADE